MTIHRSHRAPVVAAIALAGLGALAASKAPVTDATGGGTLRLPLKAEKLAAPEGATLPAWETVELVARGETLYDVRLTPGDGAPRLERFDLALLVPRVPRLARGNDALTRLALIQREFNRNEVHNPRPDGTDFSIANNCLERGLWEVKLAKTESGKTTTLFHAWFEFPRDLYAKLFQAVNPGLDFDRYDPLFAKYPGVGGFVLPLDDLRRVKSERDLGRIERHDADALDRLPEQKNKIKLLKTDGIVSYGDVSRAERQPIVTAKFNSPGIYDSADSMRFDLTWLGQPDKIVWREVENPRSPGTFPEIEIAFHNGYRILAADAELARLPSRSAPPAADGDVLRFVCGIGTPVFHATAAERAKEISEDRPRYLMILDGKGNHVDNHLTGMDALYAWRDSGGQLHLWLVGYERIAIVAHISVGPQPGA